MLRKKRKFSKEKIFQKLMNKMIFHKIMSPPRRKMIWKKKIKKRKSSKMNKMSFKKVRNLKKVGRKNKILIKKS